MNKHPRDLFDFKYMDASFDDIRDGLLLALAGSDKPILESLAPNMIDQHDALEKQFAGMTDLPFSYADYENTRLELHQFVNNGLTILDRQFLMSFEQGVPDWSLCSAGDLSNFPSVQWKLQNIRRLQQNNPKKHKEGLTKLEKHFSQ